MTIIENLMDILKNETVKKTRKEEIEYYDAFIQNIETIFTSKYFNTTKLDEGKDEIYETQKIKVTLTTSKNQKNNLNDNTTSIDLGKCEEELKKFYNLKDNEIIYIRKMDIIQEGMRIPKIEYDVYSKLNGDNLVKLNLSICNKTEIYLYIPIKDIGNLDQLNKSSGVAIIMIYVQQQHLKVALILFMKIDKKNISIKQYVKMIVILIIIIVLPKKQYAPVKLKSLLLHLLICILMEPNY